MWHLNDQQCTSINITDWKNTVHMCCCNGCIHITRPSVTPRNLICIPQNTVFSFITPEMYWLMTIFIFFVISPDCIFTAHMINVNVCSRNHCSALPINICVGAFFKKLLLFWDDLFAFCATVNVFCIFSKVTGACSLFSDSGASSHDHCSALKGPVCSFVDHQKLKMTHWFLGL